MSLFGLGSRAAEEAAVNGRRLANRFIAGNGGIREINGTAGNVQTHSTEAIKESIKAWSQVDKDVADFVQEMDNMEPRHLGLAHDIIDLTHENDGCFSFAPIETDLKEMTNVGKTWLAVILDKLPKISRENPAALDLIQEVVDQSGVENSKFFIQQLLGRYDLANSTGIAEQMKAVKPLVKDIVDSFGGPICEFTDPYFEKRTNFFNFILDLCSNESKPENLRFIKKASEIADQYKLSASINFDQMRRGDTERIRRNLEVLPQLLENAEAQGLTRVEASEFLTKNINLD